MEIHRFHKICAAILIQQKRNAGTLSRSGIGDTMLIDLNGMEEREIPCMNNGTGTMTAKMYADDLGRAVLCRIRPGGSIGLHKHDNGDDVNYVISGSGKAICDGQEEVLKAGACHICRKGSEHSIVNTGTVDLVLFTYVTVR